MVLLPCNDYRMPAPSAPFKSALKRAAESSLAEQQPPAKAMKLDDPFGDGNKITVAYLNSRLKCATVGKTTVSSIFFKPTPNPYEALSSDDDDEDDPPPPKPAANFPTSTNKPAPKPAPTDMNRHIGIHEDIVHLSRYDWTTEYTQCERLSSTYMDFMNASGVIFGVHDSIDSSMLRENLKSHEAYRCAKKLRNQLQELKSQAKTKKRNDLLGSLNSIIQGHRLRRHDICDAYLSTPTDSAWKDALCDENIAKHQFSEAAHDDKENQPLLLGNKELTKCSTKDPLFRASTTRHSDLVTNFNNGTNILTMSRQPRSPVKMASHPSEAARTLESFSRASVQFFPTIPHQTTAANPDESMMTADEQKESSKDEPNNKNKQKESSKEEPNADEDDDEPFKEGTSLIMEGSGAEPTNNAFVFQAGLTHAREAEGPYPPHGENHAGGHTCNALKRLITPIMRPGTPPFSNFRDSILSPRRSLTTLFESSQDKIVDKGSVYAEFVAKISDASATKESLTSLLDHDASLKKNQPNHPESIPKLIPKVFVVPKRSPTLLEEPPFQLDGKVGRPGEDPPPNSDDDDITVDCDQEMDSLSSKRSYMDTDSNVSIPSGRLRLTPFTFHPEAQLTTLIDKTATKFRQNPSLLLPLLVKPSRSVSSSSSNAQINSDFQNDILTTETKALQTGNLGISDIRRFCEDRFVSGSLSNFDHDSIWNVQDGALANIFRKNNSDIAYEASLHTIRALDLIRFVCGVSYNEEKIRQSFPKLFANSLMDECSILQLHNEIATNFDVKAIRRLKDYILDHSIYLMERPLVPDSPILSGPPNPLEYCTADQAARIRRHIDFDSNVMKEEGEQDIFRDRFYQERPGSSRKPTSLEKVVGLSHKCIRQFVEAKRCIRAATFEMQDLIHISQLPPPSSIIGRSIASTVVFHETSPADIGQGKFSMSWAVCKPLTLQQARDLPDDTANPSIQTTAEVIQSSHELINPTGPCPLIDGLSMRDKLNFRVCRKVNVRDPDETFNDGKPQLVLVNKGYAPTMPLAHRNAFLDDTTHSFFNPDPTSHQYAKARNKQGDEINNTSMLTYDTPMSVLLRHCSLEEAVMLEKDKKQEKALVDMTETRFSIDKQLRYVCDDIMRIPLTHAQPFREGIRRNIHVPGNFEAVYVMPFLSEILGPAAIFDLAPENAFINRQHEHPEYISYYENGPNGALQLHNHLHDLRLLSYESGSVESDVEQYEQADNDLTPHSKLIRHSPFRIITPSDPLSPPSFHELPSLIIANNCVSKIPDSTNHFVVEQHNINQQERIYMAVSTRSQPELLSDDNDVAVFDPNSPDSVADAPMAQPFDTSPPTIEDESINNNSRHQIFPITQPDRLPSTNNPPLRQPNTPEIQVHDTVRARTADERTDPVPPTNMERGVSYLLKLVSPKPIETLSTTIPTNTTDTSTVTSPEVFESVSKPPPVFPFLHTPFNRLNNPLESRDDQINNQPNENSPKPIDLPEKKHVNKKLRIVTEESLNHEDSNMTRHDLSGHTHPEDPSPSDTFSAKPNNSDKRTNLPNPETDEISVTRDSTSPCATNNRARMPKAKIAYNRHPPSFDPNFDGMPSDSDGGSDDDLSDDGKRRATIRGTRPTGPEPTAELITKILLRSAKNANLRRLNYPSNMEMRRRFFNTFIDSLRITCNISPWTSPLFNEWPNRVIYTHPCIGTALFNLIYAYLGEGCQQQLDPLAQDGNDTLFFLKRRMAPITPDYIDQCHEVFRQIKQAPKESASIYFSRIRSIDRECRHAGIMNSDKQLFKRALKGGCDNRLYEASYERFKADARNSERENKILPSFAELECDMLDIDDSNSLSTNHNHRQRHHIFTASDSQSRTQRHTPNSSHRPPSNSLFSTNHNRSNSKTCTYCNKSGHTKFECRKKVRDAQAQPNGHQPRNNRNQTFTPSTYRPSGRFSGNNNNQSRGGNQRNNTQRPRFSDSERREWLQNIVCNHCGQTGHYANRCPRSDRQSNSNSPRFPRPNQGGNRRPNGSNNSRERAFLAYTTDGDSNNTHEQLCIATSNHDIPPFNDPFNATIFDSFATDESANLTFDGSEEKSDTTFDFESPNDSMDESPRMDLPHDPGFRSLVRSDPSTVFEPEDPLSMHQRFGTTELSNWLPDSGASSHHTPCLGDLINPQNCHVPVVLADGSIQHAQKYGRVTCPFFTDDGTACTISLEKVYYTPGLNQRLMSLTSITATENFAIGINNKETTIGLPNGKTFTWAYQRAATPNLSESLNMASDQDPNDTTNTPPSDSDSETTIHHASQKGTHSPELTTLPLELTSVRLGFKNIRTLMAGSIHKVWRNHQLYPSTSTESWPIRIAVSHKRARKKIPIPQPKEPFHMLHLDLIKNPFQFGITTQSNFSAYLFIVVTPGKLVGWIGLDGESTRDIIKALDKWLVHTQLHGRVNSARIIRADAGSAFTSEKFIRHCADEYKIKIEAAAPHHQEQNGMCEAKWKELHSTANAILNNARLGGAFFHHAHAYAAEIINVIPGRNIVDEFNMPTTPYFVCYRRKPTLSNFRVFGCPTFFKRYEPSKDGRSVTKPKQIQRAIRGIFVGFPENSTGWLMYSASCSPKLTVSVDVYFDERFNSALSFDSKPFAGAVPIRTFADPSTATNRHFESYNDPKLQHTGSVADFGMAPSSYITQDVDVVEEGKNNDSDGAEAIASAQQHNNQSKFAQYERAMVMVELDYIECEDNSPRGCSLESISAIQDDTEEDVYKYLPEPQSFKAILKCAPEVTKAWLHSLGEELKNLIDHGTFILGETPSIDELIIMVKLVLKAKQNADGKLEKLKARLVARGDMEKRRMKKITSQIRRAIEKQKQLDQQDNNKPVHRRQAPIEVPPTPEDTWSPSATSRLVKLFLAIAATSGRQVKSADFIGAYLQSKVVGRHFVRLPKEYTEYFPQYAKYFGVPLLLGKGMYGLVYSGKFWNIEFSEWLYSIGFIQSQTDPSYFILRRKHGEWLRLIFYVDDMLYYGSNDSIEKEFEEMVKRRFDVKFLGPAQWFLQMRIHRHSDKSYSLDQQRYALNTLRRYDPRGVYPKRATPLPPDYIYSKDNKPKTPKDKSDLERRFPDIHFRSAVCTLLYLAYNTRADILFAVCKLAKACIDPGQADHEALRWLIGYIRNKPDLAIKFYPNKSGTPIHQILQTARVPISDLVVFTDASWQDCPDTGRSTVGHLIFYNGALIDANSSMPSPVAMSSAESEYLSACNGAMAVAHIRMLVYDMLYLGTKDWKMAMQSLPSNPAILMVDNEAAVQMAKNGRMTRKTRHIERRFHFVRQGQQDGVHQLHWISGKQQLADIMTKTQAASKIDPFLPQIFYKLPSHMTQRPGTL